MSRLLEEHLESPLTRIVLGCLEAVLFIHSIECLRCLSTNESHRLMPRSSGRRGRPRQTVQVPQNALYSFWNFTPHKASAASKTSLTTPLLYLGSVSFLQATLAHAPPCPRCSPPTRCCGRQCGPRNRATFTGQTCRCRTGRTGRAGWWSPRRFSPSCSSTSSRSPSSRASPSCARSHDGSRGRARSRPCERCSIVSLYRCLVNRACVRSFFQSDVPGL